MMTCASSATKRRAERVAALADAAAVAALHVADSTAPRSRDRSHLVRLAAVVRSAQGPTHGRLQASSPDGARDNATRSRVERGASRFQANGREDGP